jgi:integrase
MPVVMRPLEPPAARLDVPRIRRACTDLEDKVRARRDRSRLMYPDRKVPGDSAIRTQFARVAVLHRFMFGRDWACDDVEWARDTAAVMAAIDRNPAWRTESSRNAHRAALAAVLRNIEGFEETARVYGHSSTVAYDNLIKPQRMNNTLEGTRREHYLPWDDLVRAVRKAPAASADAALMASYVFAPPRRLQDYSHMRVVRDRSTPAAKLPVGCNYVVLDDAGTPVEYVFNVFKTSPTFGQQTLPVRPRVADVLREYVARGRIAHMGWLFPNANGEAHSNFSRVVSRTFQRYTGKRITGHLLRHAYVTMVMSSRPTLAERQLIATHMAHSLATQAEYDVIDSQLEPTQQERR